MPHPPRLLFLRARHGSTALLSLAMALVLGSGATPPSHASAAATQTSSAAEPARTMAEVASLRSARNPMVAERDALAADLEAVAPSAPTQVDPTTPLRDTIGPSAVLDPLVVEHGDLTVHWRDIDGLRAGIATQNVLIEQAAATPTGCGEFTLARGVSLGDGTYDQGTLSLGKPPSSGCLRVSLALTDRVGRSSITSSQPYRVQPPAPVVSAKPAPPKWSGRYNLFRANAFVTQKTFKWCVAASVQMMVNLVRDRTDRSRATQARMIAYAQRWDNGPYGDQGGTDVTGWINALRHYGAGRYRAVGATTAARALRVAATAMRQTGRPAGILVMEGQHAWVLHGFESRTDPRKDRRATITAVRISGPLYPVQQQDGYDPRPNTRLTATRLARYFQPTIVGAMVGKYVVVIPTH
ncbi:MAG: hypothetical protein WEE50_00860 [Chloroflexota bacterium]